MISNHNLLQCLGPLDLTPAQLTSNPIPLPETVYTNFDCDVDTAANFPQIKQHASWFYHVMAEFILHQSGYATFSQLMFTAHPSQLIIWIVGFLIENEIRPDGDFVVNQALLRITKLLCFLGHGVPEAVTMHHELKETGCLWSPIIGVEELFTDNVEDEDI